MPEEPSLPAEQAERLNRLIELERSQIGSEIHDGLLPLVFPASAATSSLLRDDHLGEDHRDRLQQGTDWLTQAMTTGRQILAQVYPPELANRSWITAAQDVLAKWYPESSAQVEWDIAEEMQGLPSVDALTVYRIVVEAVRNAFNHGEASRVSVRGQRLDDSYHLEVKDDGLGFDPKQVGHDRFGIKSMRARAELIGGSLEIVSQPGSGTTVLCHLRAPRS